jgi:hypothetical protein
MLLLYVEAYKSIEQLLEKEMRLGGLSIHLATEIGSRVTF